LIDPGCLNEPAAARITPSRTKTYVEHLESLKNGTWTILGRLKDLGAAAKVMSPNGDWRFINDISSRIRTRHRPVRDKHNMKLTDDLLALGLQLMNKAKSKTGLRAAVLFRDGLLIAFLALTALRRRNLAGLRLGKNLIETNGRWTIELQEDETKTHAPHELELPDLLVEPLCVYFRKYRPVLASLHGRWCKPVGDALWVSKDGSPMTQMAIYDRIRAHTKKAFGVPMNPHLFRDAAATIMAIADPQHIRASAPLLGHRSFSTTERNYIQAKGFEAQRKFLAVVFGAQLRGRKR
jgi:integrase